MDAEHAAHLLRATELILDDIDAAMKLIAERCSEDEAGRYRVRVDIIIARIETARQWILQSAPGSAAPAT